MKVKIIGWVVFFVVLVIVFLGISFYKNRMLNKILNAIQTRKFKEAFDIIDSFSCKYFFPAFNREYMRLNAYYMMGDAKEIKNQLELILHMRINKKQKANVAIKAFYFYVDENNRVKAKEMLEDIKGLISDVMYEQMRLIYEIVLLGKTNYVDLMEEQVKTEKDAFNRGMYHYFLAIQYGHLDEKKKRLEHLRSAKKDMKGTPYEIKINQMLKEK